MGLLAFQLYSFPSSQSKITSTVTVAFAAPTKPGSVRSCYWYHKTAIGAEVKTDITWHGDRAANFINNMMSQGACLIDTAGVVSLRCLEA